MSLLHSNLTTVSFSEIKLSVLGFQTDPASRIAGVSHPPARQLRWTI